METAEVAKKGSNSITSLMEDVEEKIIVIRNQQVIADADVATLYEVQTKEINQAVRNNPDKFPTHYMFVLTKSELCDLKSKILTSNVSDNNRKKTKVFTERGLYMLATILKGDRARTVTFAIIETFAQIRELKRELLAMHQEADKDKQKAMMQHFGDVLTDIVMPDLRTSETESSLEINFFIGKLKHTVKRVRKEDSVN
jgi:phage regulator Rha-like protein